MPLVKTPKVIDQSHDDPPAYPVSSARPISATPPPAQMAKREENKVAPLQPRDMSPEQKRIQRSGLYQAALHSVGILQFGGTTFESYLERVREAADAGLSYVNER